MSFRETIPIHQSLSGLLGSACADIYPIRRRKRRRNNSISNQKNGIGTIFASSPTQTNQKKKIDARYLFHEPWPTNSFPNCYTRATMVSRHLISRTSDFDTNLYRLPYKTFLHKYHAQNNARFVRRTLYNPSDISAPSFLSNDIV